MWRIKPENEAAFVEAWKALGTVFLSLAQPATKGTLIQSLADPTLYYSFGPWTSQEEIAAMRSDPAAQAALQRLRDLCEESAAGGYRVVAEMGRE
jgi:quinol monooxygenase YgiN